MNEKEIIQKLKVLSRKMIERAKELQHEKQRLEVFLDYLPCAAWIKDLEGHYVFVNATLARVFLRQKEEWIGKKDSEIWPAEMVRRLRKSDRTVITKKCPVESIAKAPHSDGWHRWIFRKFPLFDSKGKVEFIGGIAFDLENVDAKLLDLH